MGKAFHLCDVVCYGFVLLEVDFCFKCVVDDNQFVRVVVTCLTAFELKRLVFFATNVASLTGLAFVVKIVCINCLVAIKCRQGCNTGSKKWATDVQKCRRHVTTTATQRPHLPLFPISPPSAPPKTVSRPRSIPLSRHRQSPMFRLSSKSSE